MIDKVYIILINFNTYKDTIECLDSLLKLNYENYQIIVVDNNSSDDSIKNLTKWIHNYENGLLYSKKEAINGGFPKKESLLNNPVILIDAKENNGFAAGNNIALQYALAKDDFKYVWLLNNDTVVDPSALSELVNGIQQYNNVGAVGSKILYYDRRNVLQNLGTKIDSKSFFKLCKPVVNLKENNIDEGQFDYDFEVNDIMGASLLVSKDVIKDVGLMPEEYFLYGEETDWNFNFQKHGYKLMTIYKSKVYHKKSVSTGGDFSDTTLYYRTRNQLLLQKKYMSFGMFFLYSVMYVFKKIVYILFFSKKNKKIIFQGLLDGIFIVLNIKSGGIKS